MGQIKELIEYLLQVFKIWVIVMPWERALFVRRGKRIKERRGGLYFKLPYLDSVYVQESRLRVTEIPMQTLTSKDGKTLTVNSSLGYRIAHLKMLYDTLAHPEITLGNIAMGATAEIVFANGIESLTPQFIQDRVLAVLKKEDYGLDFDYFKITNYAVVRTYRLIQDGSWTNEGLDITEKKK